MKAEIVLKITNEWEAARLLSLIRDGHKILNKQDRSQRGIDGYTNYDLNSWIETLSKATSVRCKYADGEI